MMSSILKSALGAVLAVALISTACGNDETVVCESRDASAAAEDAVTEPPGDSGWSGTYDAGATCSEALVLGESPLSMQFWYGPEDNYSWPCDCNRPSDDDFEGSDAVIGFVPPVTCDYTFGVSNYLPGGPVALFLVTDCANGLSGCLDSGRGPASVTAQLEQGRMYYVVADRLPSESGGQSFSFSVSSSCDSE